MDHRFYLVAKAAWLPAAEVLASASEVARRHIGMVARGKIESLGDAVIANGDALQSLDQSLDPICYGLLAPHGSALGSIEFFGKMALIDADEVTLAAIPPLPFQSGFKPQ